MARAGSARQRNIVMSWGFVFWWSVIILLLIFVLHAMGVSSNDTAVWVTFGIINIALIVIVELGREIIDDIRWWWWRRRRR
jgi:hypothetical protein